MSQKQLQARLKELKKQRQQRYQPRQRKQPKFLKRSRKFVAAPGVTGSKLQCLSTRGSKARRRKHHKRTLRVKEIALFTLQALGVPEPMQFYHDHSDKQLHGFINLFYALTDANHTIQWGDEEMALLLQRLHAMNYVSTTIQTQWHTILDAVDICDEEITDAVWEAYDIVQANCKELGDNKLPVSPKLLRQLCRATDLLLDEITTQPYLSVSGWLPLVHA